VRVTHPVVIGAVVRERSPGSVALESVAAVLQRKDPVYLKGEAGAERYAIAIVEDRFRALDPPMIAQSKREAVELIIVGPGSHVVHGLAI
jgi:hypothetical protein